MHWKSGCAFLKVILADNIAHGHAGYLMKWGLSRQVYSLKSSVSNGTFTF